MQACQISNLENSFAVQFFTAAAADKVGSTYLPLHYEGNIVKILELLR